MAEDSKATNTSYRPPSPGELRPRAEDPDYVRSAGSGNPPPALPAIEPRPRPPKAPLPVRLKPRIPPPAPPAAKAPPTPPSPPKKASAPPPTPKPRSAPPPVPAERASDPLEFELGADGLPPPTLDPFAAPEAKRRRIHPLALVLWLSAGLILAAGAFLYMQDHGGVAEVGLEPVAVVGQDEPPDAAPAEALQEVREAEEPETSEPDAAVEDEPAPESAQPPEANVAPARPPRSRRARRPRNMRPEARMDPAPPPAMDAPVAMAPAMNDGALPQQPTRQQVQRGLLAVRGAVRACMERGGRVPVRVTILGRTGRVTSARVEDAVFARQPTGGCIARAVRRAQFPRFQQDRLVVVYPYEF